MRLLETRLPIRISSGQYYDAETGLHQNYYRAYQPDVGRYMSTDPPGISGGINLYQYVAANPIMGIDRFGLYCTYSQSSGEMRCTNPRGETYYRSQGYSGAPRCKDDPDKKDEKSCGPTPRDWWEVGETYDSPNTGRNTMVLIPQPGNTCFNTGRECNTFRMHGDSMRNPGEASEGCIVLPPTRTQIPKGEMIDVIP